MYLGLCMFSFSGGVGSVTFLEDRGGGYVLF